MCGSICAIMYVMCFSAEASFVVGAALSVTGVAIIKKTQIKTDLPFAIIPLLFGIQQIVEGAVWLSFQCGLPLLNHVATFVFMGFAYVFWPIYVPFSIGLLESDPDRKKILNVIQFIGFAVALYLLSFILNNPVISQVVNKSIVYTMPAQYGVLLVGMYMVATCVSCLFSSHRIINIFGVLIGVSFAITYYFYTASYVSVWCFFSAVLSVLVYMYLRNSKEHRRSA